MRVQWRWPIQEVGGLRVWEQVCLKELPKKIDPRLFWFSLNRVEERRTTDVTIKNEEATKNDTSTGTLEVQNTRQRLVIFFRARIVSHKGLRFIFRNAKRRFRFLPINFLFLDLISDNKMSQWNGVRWAGLCDACLLELRSRSPSIKIHIKTKYFHSFHSLRQFCVTNPPRKLKVYEPLNQRGPPKYAFSIVRWVHIRTQC